MPLFRLSPSVAASSSPLRVLCAAWPMLALALFTLLALPLASAQAVSGNVAVPLQLSSAAGDLSATAANYPTTTPMPAFSADIDTALGGVADGAGNLYIILYGCCGIYNGPEVVEVTGRSTGNPQVVVVAGGQSGFNSPPTPNINYPVPATSVYILPNSIAVDNAGNLYISDDNTNMVEEVTGISSGNPQIIAIAGGGTHEISNTIPQIATSVTLSVGSNGQSLGLLAVDNAGNLYITGNNPNGVVAVDKLVLSTGKIICVAGGGTVPATPAYSESSLTTPQPANSVVITNLSGMAVDKAGNLYIADAGNNPAELGLIEEVTGLSTANPLIRVVAGMIQGFGGLAFSGNVTSPVTTTPQNASSVQISPQALTMDSAGNVYFIDESDYEGFNRPYIIDELTGLSTTNPQVAIIAGSGNVGTDWTYNKPLPLSGPAISEYTNFEAIEIWSDQLGNIYFSELTGGDVPSQVGELSTNTTLPTTAVGAASASQNISVELTAASAISSITVPKAQNGAQEFTVGAVTGCVMDGVTSNAANTICTVPITFNPQYPGLRTGALTVNNGSSIVGTVGLTGMGTGPLGIFQPGTASVLNTGSLTLANPFGVAVDGAGDLYITDTGNSRVVEVTAAGTASVLSTGGLTLKQPFGVAVDGAGDVYIADTVNSSVVEVTTAGTASVLSTGGLTLAEPFSVAVDGAGDLYIADYGNSRVVKINQASQALSFTSTGTGDSSAQQTMTVENIGNQPLNFTALNITTTGLTTSIFDLNGPTTCTDSTSLVAGAACNLGVEFAPTTPGNFTGTVNITDNNAAGAVQQATLSGTGTGYAASILLSENPSSSVTYGTPVTVTATLSGSNGTPIGNITYTLDGVMQPSVALSPTSGNGVASFTLPGTLSVGTHSVLVNYAGDNNYTESTLESSFNLTVNAVATTTTLAQPSSSTITAGGSVTLTATVVVGSTPVTSGTVTFASGTTSIGAAQLNASGVATLTTTTLPVGTDSITASFVGTANDAASNSTPAVTVTVNAATGPGVTLAPSNLSFGSTVVGTPAAAAQSVTLTNNGTSPLTISAITATGDFALDPSTTCSTSNQVAAGGSCTVAVSFVPTAAGTRTGTVTISDNASGGTQVIALTGAATAVAAAITTTTLTALPSTITAGGSVTLTATVVVGSTPVTSGTVTFASGTTSIGAAQLNASGVATLTTTTLPVGTDSITASFVDTANDAASNSTPAVTVTVNAATGPGAAAITTTTLTALPSTITAGSGVTLTATVSVGTTPVTSGTVTFSSGSTSIGAAQLNSTGNAVLTTTILPTGSDSITASFVGTANDAASNSTPLTITVNAAPPATNASYFITASPTSLSIAQGQTGTTTLTLTPTGGYTGTLVLSCGNLPSYVTCTFSQGGATNNTVTLGSSGQSGSVILTIQTNVATARLEAMPAFRPASPQTPSSPLLPAMLIGWPGGLAGVVVAFKRRRKGAKQPVRLMPLCLLVLLTGAMAVGLSGCGGSNMMTSTPMGVSTIVVTATSTTSSGQTSGASQSLPLTITISQ